MDLELYQRIENSSAHTQNRIDNGTFIVQNSHLLEDLIAVSFSVDNKIHIRACCILEKALELQLDLISPHLDSVCDKIAWLKNDSAVRSISRFIMLMVQDNTRKSNQNQNYLTENQLQKITENCFDWLISDLKIASKVYAMYTLYELGKTQDWIFPELKTILEQDTAKHSAGYKAAARETLKKLRLHKL
jgi:hypothetical protein